MNLYFISGSCNVLLWLWTLHRGQTNWKCAFTFGDAPSGERKRKNNFLLSGQQMVAHNEPRSQAPPLLLPEQIWKMGPLSGKMLMIWVPVWKSLVRGWVILKVFLEKKTFIYLLNIQHTADNLDFSKSSPSSCAKLKCCSEKASECNN